jgi:8-oxo-dGTP diphosphatase
MALSNYEAGFEACAERLERGLNATKLPVYVQFREKTLSGDALIQAFEHCYGLCQKTGQAMLLNSDTWVNLREHLDALPCPLHLTQAHLLSGQFQDLQCAGASVHDAGSLRIAFDRGLSYAVLGAVKQTTSHPEQSGLGWERFLEITQAARLPVFAIGGLAGHDISDARLHGAHGIAMLSQFGVA